MDNKETFSDFDPLFEFERLKFEIQYISGKLLTTPGELASFKYRFQQLERKLLEWKERGEKIASSLGK